MKEMPRDRWSRYADQGKPYLGVLFLQLGYAFNGVIVKNALNKGLNPCTFSVQRNIAAVIVFGPFALYFERSRRSIALKCLISYVCILQKNDVLIEKLKLLNFDLCCDFKPKQILTKETATAVATICVLEDNVACTTRVRDQITLQFDKPVLDQILYYTGMKYTTATFAVAMCNILPALTFFMAWIFRLEKVNIKRLHSQAKIVGTLVTVGGAMVMTLVNGPPIPLPWTNVSNVHHPLTNSTVSQDQHVKGAVMITAGCFCWASFYILQAVTLKEYPAQLSLTTLICMMGALQGTVMTFLIEKGKSGIWSIKWDTKLFATLYSGIVRSGASYYISGLVMKEKGPFFVTAFNPLGMVIVAIVSSFTLAEEIHLGRVVGAIVIVIGLYLIIWGKSKDASLSDSGNNEIEVATQETIPDKNLNGIQKSDFVDGVIREDVDVEASV